MTNFLKSKFAKAAFGIVVVLCVVLGAASASAYTFTAPTLKYGSKSAAVMELQKVLNANGYKVSDSGAGSPGMESMYFGTKTKAAVMKWQAASNLGADGVVGPKSMAVLNGMPAGSNNGGTTGSLCPNGNTLASNCTLPPSGGTQTGPVTAMLSTDNPASATLVAGQATADLAHFTFNGTGTVTNVTLKRIGVSSDSTPSNVYLFDGATRLTDASSVSNNGIVAFNVPAGIFTVSGSKTISVRSDIAGSTSGQTVGVMLQSFTTTGGTAVTANLSGNIHSIASASLAAVSAGTVTPSGGTINPGAGITVWQSTLTISNRDVWVKRLALRNVGSAPASAFANFKLYVNGTQVSSAASLDSMGYVTFDMSSAPVSLVSGSRVVRVDADLVSGASRTFQFSLRQAADVDFTDSSFGVNITPTSTPWASSSANTISGTSGGTLTIERDVTSPSTNLVNAGSDVNLGTFKVTAYGEPIKLETIRAAYTGSSALDDADDSLRNGRVLINGVQYGSTATLNNTTAGSPAYTSYTLNYTVMPGTPVMMEVHADIYNNGGGTAINAGTDTITAVIAAGSSNAIRQDSLGSFSAPGTAVSANTLTVASTSMTLAKNGTYANQTTSLPANNFKVGSWNLSGSSIEDILLTTLSFDVDEVVSTEFDEGDLTNMYVVVKNGGTIVAQPSPLATVSATDNNFNLNYTLAKNNNLTIELFANMADDGSDSAIDAADSFKTDLTVTGTSLVGGSSVTATSADTDGQTIAYGAASITATADASTPVAAIVYDNQEVTVAAIKFAAITSAYNITDLTFTLGSATAASTINLYDGVSLVASRPAATTVTFSGLNWNVPVGNKVLTVKLALGTVVDASGDGTGSTAGSSLLTTLTSFLATNVSTGVNAAGTESNPAGNATYVYAATPTITNVAMPSSNVTAGTNTFAKFTISANGGPIAWEKIKFTILRATTGAAVANTFTVWDENGTQVAGTATLTDAGTADNDCGDAADTSCTVAFVATTEQGVSTSHTYSLKGTVSGVLTDGDYFATNISQPSSFAAADDYTAAAATSASFVWSDLTGNGHDIASTTVTDWNNGYLVKFLATDAQTLTRSL
jgi:hypothetical protein